MTAQKGQASVILARLASQVARESLLRKEDTQGLNDEAGVWISILRQAKRDPAQKAEAIGQLRARGFPLAPAVLAVKEVTDVPPSVVKAVSAPALRVAPVAPPVRSDSVPGRHPRPTPTQIRKALQPQAPVQQCKTKDQSWGQVLLVLLLLPVILPIGLLVVCIKALAPSLLKSIELSLKVCWWTIKIAWKVAGILLACVVVLVLMFVACAAANDKQ